MSSSAFVIVPSFVQYTLQHFGSAVFVRVCVCFVEFCRSCMKGACLHVLRAIISFACFASAQCGSGRGVYHHREVGRKGLCCGTCPLVFVEMHCCIAHWQCRRGMIFLNAVLRPSRQYMQFCLPFINFTYLSCVSTNPYYIDYIGWCSRCSDFASCVGACSWLEPVSCCHSSVLFSP